MSFSGGLVLTDLNDYIAPSQTCIKPVEVIKKTNISGEIRLDDTGQYYEVSREGEEFKLEKANITLNDCLACSGCITSAESILVSMQSHEELVNIAAENSVFKQLGQLDKMKTIIVSISPQSIVSLSARYDLQPLQVARKLTALFMEQYGVTRVLDTSFARDFALLESATEFSRRYQTYQKSKHTIDTTRDGIAGQNEGGVKRRIRGGGTTTIQLPGMTTTNALDFSDVQLPMLASACPGWICYAEKTHGYLLPLISTVKSPQQITGSLVKDYIADAMSLNPDQIFHVAVMPCYDKKLEASRSDFYNDLFKTRDVDCVITTGEVEKLFQGSLTVLPEASLDNIFFKHSNDSLISSAGSSSGGYLEYILAYAAENLFGHRLDLVDISNASMRLLHTELNETKVQFENNQQQSRGLLTVQVVRNTDYKEYILRDDSTGTELLRFASVYGFKNIQNLMRKIKSAKAVYHYVEIMACPGGCINGGGQISAPEGISPKTWITQTESIYRSIPLSRPDDNLKVKELYRDWLDGADGERSRQMLHTQYHRVKEAVSLSVKW